eukprot:scaffold20790_cov31-Prasinocladus_malaysianus.AAC.1
MSETHSQKKGIESKVVHGALGSLAAAPRAAAHVGPDGEGLLLAGGHAVAGEYYWPAMLVLVHQAAILK